MSKKAPVFLQSDLLESKKELLNQSHTRSISKTLQSTRGGIASANVSGISYGLQEEFATGSRGQNRSHIQGPILPREELSALLNPVHFGDSSRYFSPKGLPGLSGDPTPTQRVQYSPAATILDMVLSSKKNLEQERTPHSNSKHNLPESTVHPLSNAGKYIFFLHML